jgi:hypothetical protein
MPRITYETGAGEGVSDEDAAVFGREVDRVLADPRGWAKYGYQFARDASRPQLRIRLETSAAADELCGARGFSCWRPGPNDIVIRLGNWMGGSASRLPLDRYRNYVINHEVGHALGLPHRKCPAAECARRGMATCPASVMQQMTRGPEHVSPCVEADWPLDPDWGIDDPSGEARARVRARAHARGLSGIPLIFVAILLVLIACLITFGVTRARCWPVAWGVKK